MTLHLIAAVDKPNKLQQRNREILQEDHVSRLDRNLTDFQRQVQHYPSKHTEVEISGKVLHIEQPAFPF